ncbi:MAG: hypothetical protein R3C28_13120 [Pirellulaceae bacterium]
MSLFGARTTLDAWLPASFAMMARFAWYRGTGGTQSDINRQALTCWVTCHLLAQAKWFLNADDRRSVAAAGSRSNNGGHTLHGRGSILSTSTISGDDCLTATLPLTFDSSIVNSGTGSLSGEPWHPRSERYGYKHRHVGRTCASPTADANGKPINVAGSSVLLFRSGRDARFDRTGLAINTNRDLYSQSADRLCWMQSLM